MLVHGDCFGGSTGEGRAWSGREGAWFDWATLGKGGAVSVVKRLEKVTLWIWMDGYAVTAQAMMLAAIERYFIVRM